MSILIKLENLHDFEFRDKNISAVIGFFDGVHTGHLKIINACIKRAKEINGESVIFTFDKPPANILKGKIDKKLITSFSDKIKLLKATGTNYIIVAKFDNKFAELKPGQFCSDVLLKKLNIRELFIGQGFKFGKDSSGDAAYIRKFFKLSEERFGHPIKINEVLIHKIKGIPVSSTAIRNFYDAGNIESITLFLGRYPSIKGMVIKGDKRGRLLGYPTANIDVFEKYVTPSDGVYAGFVKITGIEIMDDKEALAKNKNTDLNSDAKKFTAVINIGNNPTFDGKRKWIESHIIDFNADIYGKKIEVFFLKKLRDEITFRNKEELIKQIKLDIDKTEETIMFFSSK